MDESDFNNYSESCDRSFINHDDRFEDTFDKSGDHSDSRNEDKSKERAYSTIDSNRWNNEVHHQNSLDRQDTKFDDLNVILPIDSTDSAIGSDYLIAGLCGSDKPTENGIYPLLDDDGHLNRLPDQLPPQDTGCAVDCVYYTLMCCECSIL